MKIPSFLLRFKGCAPQLLAVVLGTLNAISDGMQYGWTSPMVPRFQTSEAPFHLTEFDITWLEITYMLAGLLGLPISIFAVNKIGRKKSVLAASSACMIGWILIGIADSVIYLYLARLIMGISADVAFIASPMYIAEVAHQNIRGFLSGMIHLMFLSGILLIYCIGPFVPLYVSSVVGGSILILQLFTFSFMPESPYYLLYVDREAEAKTSLMKLRGSNVKDVEEELTEIAAGIKRQKTEKGRLQDLWLIKSNRKALIIMTILYGAQHMAGITVMTMNVHLILAAAESIYLPAETSAILFASLMWLSTVVSLFLIDRFGRKVLLINSSVLSGCMLLILGVFFHLKYNNVDVSEISWIPIVCVMFFAAFFKSGIGVIPIVMTAELFSSKVKAMGMAYADGIYIIFSALSIYLYQYTIEVSDIFLPFYAFAACSFLTGIFTFIFIPETKGKTLEEIQIILKK